MRNLHTHKNTPCERYTTGDQKVVFRHHLYSPKKIKNIQKQTRNDCTVYSIPTSQLTANIILTKQLFCTSTITSSVHYNHRRYHVFAHLTSLVSAAFDTIDHLLCWFGIHGSVLSWFKSYLSSCCFRVKCDTDYLPGTHPPALSPKALSLVHDSSSCTPPLSASSFPLVP